MRILFAVLIHALFPTVALAWTETSQWNTATEGEWSCQSYTGGGRFPGVHYTIDCSSQTPDPPCSFRGNFPTGYPANHELAMCWNPFPAEAEEVYVQYYVKFSSNWTWGRGSKFIFILVGGGGNIFTSVSGGSKRFYVTTQTFATNSYPPNVGRQPKMVAGRWYKHVLRLKINTPGVLDGIIQLWIDDVLTTRYSNVGFRSSSQTDRGFREITANYGAAGSDKGAGEYVWFDHSIVSTSPIGTSDFP